MDTEQARQVDLLGLIGRDTELKHVAATRGGEYAGACPFCGGEDRFRVQPARRVWWCRQCSPKWDSAIGYVMKRHGLDFQQAVRQLTDNFRQHAGSGTPSFLGGNPPSATLTRSTLEPSETWQAEKRGSLAKWQECLWSEHGTVALDWLHARGLQDATIRRAGLGSMLRAAVLIPCEVRGVLWSIKMRSLTGEPRYKISEGGVSGAPYLADWLQGKSLVVITEGELDALLLWQECHDICDVLTLGSVTAKLADRFSPFFLGGTTYLIATDDDEPGHKAAEYWLGLLGKRAIRVLPPKGKDITEAYQAGIDLWQWVSQF